VAEHEVVRRRDSSSNWIVSNGGHQVRLAGIYTVACCWRGWVIYSMYPDGHGTRHDGRQDWLMVSLGNGGRQVRTGWNVYSRVFTL